MQTPHAGALMIALGDGSVRSVSPGISCDPRDGNPLGPEWE